MQFDLTKGPVIKSMLCFPYVLGKGMINYLLKIYRHLFSLLLLLPCY